MSKDIPDGWEKKVLSDLVEVRSSNVDKKSYGDEIPVKLCNYTDVYYKNIINSSIDFMLATAKEKEIERFTLEYDDVLITKDSETPNDIAVPAYVTEKMDNVLCGYHLTLLRPYQAKTSGQYLSHAFQLPAIQHHFYILANGITRFGLTADAINNAPFIVPPLSEQQKIAKILTAVDEVIEKTQSQIDKLKDLKTGMMQELLTNGIGHTEFKDSPVGRIPAEWDVVFVGDIADVIDPQPDHRTPAEVEGGVPYIGLGDIDKSGRINFSEARKVSQAAYDKQCRGFEIHKHAFIFGKIGTIGKPSILPETRFYCLSANIVLVTTSNLLNMRYLFQIFTSDMINNQVLMQTNTTSQPALGIKKVRDFLIPIPKNESEKIRIIGTLRSIDEKIAAISKKLTASRRTKKALMQDLLTGKVRVKVDSE